MSPVPSRQSLRPRAPGQTFELWRNAEGTYSFLPADSAARAGIAPGSELVWSVEARSFEDACAAQREFLGLI